MLNQYTTVKEKIRKFNIHRDPAKLIKELKQERPCQELWFKRTTWTVEQATLIYHNLDPNAFSGLFPEDRDFIIKILDINEDIRGNLQNYLYSSIYSPQEIVVKKFIEFLKNKRYIVPTHFPDYILPEGEQSEGYEDEDDYFEEEDNSIESNFLTEALSYRGIRRETLRKRMMRDAADGHWKREKAMAKEKGKKPDYTTAADLARNDDMKKLVNIINRILGLAAVKGDEFSESGVDPEWFSDLYPGEKKRGPKKR